MTPAARRRPGLRAILVQLLPAALLSLLFSSVGVIHVTSRVLVVHAGYRLSALENEGRLLTRENDRLKIELATLRSAARLERIAREKLGLMPPAAGSVIATSAPPAQPSRLERSVAADSSPKKSDRPDAKATAVRVADWGLR